MTKELWQVLVAGAVRRLSVCCELRWLRVWKHTERGDPKKKHLIVMGYQHTELTHVQTAAPTLGQMSRDLLLHACVLRKLRLHLGVRLFVFFADVRI